MADQLDKPASDEIFQSSIAHFEPLDDDSSSCV